MARCSHLRPGRDRSSRRPSTEADQPPVVTADLLRRRARYQRALQKVDSEGELREVRIGTDVVAGVDGRTVVANSLYGVGARYRFAFGTALPYTLEFESELVRRDPPRLLESRVGGELRGTGRWVLADSDGVTDVTYEWLVETTKRWMNILAPIARPVFSWNHDVLMGDFAEGLAGAAGGALVEIVNSTRKPGQPGFYELPPI